MRELIGHIQEADIFKPASQKEVNKRQRKAGMFICPGCKKALDDVRVYSEAYQIGELQGNKIVVYGSVEELTETVGIECPECGKDIMNLIEQ